MFYFVLIQKRGKQNQFPTTDMSRGDEMTLRIKCNFGSASLLTTMDESLSNKKNGKHLNA